MTFDGKKLAEQTKALLRERMEQYKTQYGRVPCLSVLLVGDDYGSQRYVASCEKQTADVGMACRVIRMDGQSTETEVLEQLDRLNRDTNVDGILVQMPLPKQVRTEKVVDAISPEKDVDCVTDTNVANLWKQKRNDYTRFPVPCTPRSSSDCLSANC